MSWGFYGRQAELRQLGEILARGRWFFVKVTGRRRIGKIPRGHTAFAYVFDGGGFFGVVPDDEGQQVGAPQLVVFDDGDQIQIRASENGVRFLLISGKPLNEPVARYGPFVMNTKDEIEEALRDLRRGTFVK